MNKNYTVISVNDYSDANGTTRTVNCGETPTSTTAMAPMVTYSFQMPNISASDMGVYKVGAALVMTIAPAPAPTPAATPAS